MSDTPKIEIAPLRLKDALALAPLIAEYGQALKRGAPRTAGPVLCRATAAGSQWRNFWGRWLTAKWSALSCIMICRSRFQANGQGRCDHLYVHHEHRGKGIAKALVDVLADQAEGARLVETDAERATPAGNRPQGV